MRSETYRPEAASPRASGSTLSRTTRSARVSPKTVRALVPKKAETSEYQISKPSTSLSASAPMAASGGGGGVGSSARRRPGSALKTKLVSRPHCSVQ